MPSILRTLALFLALLHAGGCQLVQPGSHGKSPLLPPAVAPDAVTLEIFSAPAPLGDPQLTTLWAQVDEQSLPADVRHKLSQNGLRAGIVGPDVPDALADLLKVTDQRVSNEERSRVPIDPEPGITLRVLHPRAGKRHDLLIPHSYDQMALLQRFDGQVEGKTYWKPECRLVLRVFPEAAGRVRLDLTPELHYGEFKNRVTGSEGMFTVQQERQKQLFPELKLGATLASGEMLLVTCRPDRPGSVGHYFFTQPDGDKPLQTLWVFRVARAGPDRAFYDGPADDAGEISSDLEE